MSTVLGAQTLRSQTTLARDPPISRLIVGLGNYGAQFRDRRSNIGYRLGYHLLRQCRVEEKDIHDPHDPYANRSNNRRPDGENRDKATHSGTNARKLYRDMFKTDHAEDSWCTEWFKDYNGVWCSRIMLGNFTKSMGPQAEGQSSTHRTGLLLPQTTYDHSGDAVKLVLQAHKHIEPHHILVVSDDISMPLGTCVLSQAGDLQTQAEKQSREETDLLAALTRTRKNAGVGHVARTLGDIFGSEEAAAAVYWLRIGTQLFQPPKSYFGDSHQTEGVTDTGHAAMNDVFNEVESASVESKVLPLSAFACGLWAYSPPKAQHYLVNRLQRGKVQLDQQHHLLKIKKGLQNPVVVPNILDPHEAPQSKEAQVWSGVYKGMLNFRDSAILQASANGDRLPRIRDPTFLHKETRRIVEKLKDDNL